jgi:hypothetical protein
LLFKVRANPENPPKMAAAGPALEMFANQDLVRFTKSSLSPSDGEGGHPAKTAYGAAAVAKRSVPTLAALALGGWAFKKWRDKRRAHASYPPEATPSSPSA